MATVNEFCKAISDYLSSEFLLQSPVQMTNPEFFPSYYETICQHLYNYTPNDFCLHIARVLFFFQTYNVKYHKYGYFKRGSTFNISAQFMYMQYRHLRKSIPLKAQ
jgi:hypothetical protein